MKQVRQNDILIFHVFKPINGIVGVAKVISEVFEDNRDIWGRDRYPLRIRIELIPDLCGHNCSAVPISSLFGEPYGDGITVEPYLKGVWLVKITEGQYRKLRARLESHNP